MTSGSSRVIVMPIRNHPFSFSRNRPDEHPDIVLVSTLIIGERYRVVAHFQGEPRLVGCGPLGVCGWGFVHGAGDAVHGTAD